MPEQSAPSRTPGVYLGFDFGLRRLGAAIGQVLTGTARPLETLRCQSGEPDWQEISRLVQEWQPTGLVVGVPRHADGTDNAITAGALRFARRLEGRYGLPVYPIDEHLSSHAAQAWLTESGRRATKKNGPAVDSIAAGVILETWFAQGERR
jgi:putative Holliday junction resolvase